MLENGAEVMYYCNNRALQSRCPKTSMIERFTLLSDTALQSYTKGVKSYDHYSLLGLLMYFQKSHSLLLFFFTRRAMIIYINKHVKSPQYQTSKYRKNRYFWHLSKIS